MSLYNRQTLGQFFEPLYGATAEKLDNGIDSGRVNDQDVFLTFTKSLTAQSTVAILGMPSSSKHDSFQNKHMLQDVVYAQKKKEALAGLQWNSMVIFIFFIFDRYLEHICAPQTGIPI